MMSRSNTLANRFHEALGFLDKGEWYATEMLKKAEVAAFPLLAEAQEALDACDEAFADKAGFYNGMSPNSPCRKAWEIGQRRAEVRAAEERTNLMTGYRLEPYEPAPPGMSAARNIHSGQVLFYTSCKERDHAIRNSGPR